MSAHWCKMQIHKYYKRTVTYHINLRIIHKATLKREKSRHHEIIQSQNKRSYSRSSKSGHRSIKGPCRRLEIASIKAAGCEINGRETSERFSRAAAAGVIKGGGGEEAEASLAARIPQDRRGSHLPAKTLLQLPSLKTLCSRADGPDFGRTLVNRRQRFWSCPNRPNWPKDSVVKWT